MRFRKILLFLLPVAFLLACQKERSLRPSLEVHSPSHGFSAEPGDTLSVRIEASSDDGLEQLHISVIDKSFLKRTGSNTYDLGGTRKVKDRFLYPVPVPKGSSYGQRLRVMVESSNGKKRTAYVTGRISREPASFSRAFVVFHSAQQKVGVDYFQNVQEGLKDFKNITMDYSGSATNSLHDEFIVAGSETGDLKAFHAIDGNEIWSVPNQGSSSSFPYFLDLYSDREGKWVMAALGTERLKGFRGSSGPAFTVDALSNHMVRAAVKVEDRILTEQEPTGPDPRKWVTYYASTGSVGTEKQIPDRDIVRILEGGSGKALVLANENGQGKLFRYYVQDRYFEELASLPSGELLDGLRMSGGRTLMVHEQGMLVHRKGSSVIEVLSGAVPQAIAYDRIQDRIFVGEGKEFRVLGAQNGDIQWQKSCSDSIRAVHVLYED